MSEHELVHRLRSDGTLVPACTCGWFSPDGSHWRFERHIAKTLCAATFEVPA